MYWLTKDAETKIKDVDTSKRTVSGYFSKFGNVDSDGDIVVPGAFGKTINENRARIKHLKNHNPDQMIGRITDLFEDSYGLAFTSLISKNSFGSDALIEYQEQLITEHSIGYNIIQSKNTEEGFTELVELKLFEGSAVTWGSNPDTPVTEIKGIKTKEEIEDELTRLLKYLKVGGLTDEVYASAEIKIKQLQQAIANLKEMSHPPEDTTDAAMQEAIADYKSIFV